MKKFKDDQVVEWAGFPESLIEPGKEYFCFTRQDWESNRKSRIGDYLIFEETGEIQSGQVGMFELDGQYICRKYMEYSDGSKWLLSDMDRNPPIQLKEEDAFTVLGLLTYSINKYDHN